VETSFLEWFTNAGDAYKSKRNAAVALLNQFATRNDTDYQLEIAKKIFQIHKDRIGRDLMFDRLSDSCQKICGEKKWSLFFGAAVNLFCKKLLD